MEKKGKVTRIQKWDQKDSYGNTSFTIEFDNGDKGFYTSKTEEQTAFVIGAEKTYNIEDKEGKQGKKYSKITLPQSAKAAFNGGRPQQDPKIQMISFSMSYTKDLIVGGKLDIKELENGFNRIYNIMISKL